VLDAHEGPDERIGSLVASTAGARMMCDVDFGPVLMSTALREQLQAALGDTYALERELSAGGMSHVFVAEEVRLGRRSRCSLARRCCAPDAPFGRTSYRRRVLVAKDTLTLAGFQVDKWGTGARTEEFHLVKARHFAATGCPALARKHADSIIVLRGHPGLLRLIAERD
jgi:hypothetical protein